MGLIAHEDNIAAIREFLANITKFKDRGNEDFSLVLFKEVNKRLFAIGSCQVGNIHIIKVGRDLGLKVQTVIYNDHCRGLQFRLHAELLCGKDHEQRFTRSLEMPDESLLRESGLNTLHNSICTLILLITANDLDFAVFLVR